MWSASVNTLLSKAFSTRVLISAAVWSAVAEASIPSNFVLSLVDIKPDAEVVASDIFNFDWAIAALLAIFAFVITPSLTFVVITSTGNLEYTIPKNAAFDAGAEANVIVPCAEFIVYAVTGSSITPAKLIIKDCALAGFTATLLDVRLKVVNDPLKLLVRLSNFTALIVPVL